MIFNHADIYASVNARRSLPNSDHQNAVEEEGLARMSSVSDIPAASAEDTIARYEARLAFETDCWDMHHAFETGTADFVLLDVRSPALYASSHIPGAINLPHGKITASKMSEWPEETLFVVYCAGPHCNGADKGALRLARLGRKVKLLIGGMTGWADEGFEFTAG
jgi:rhodanese-related sulfurtransferase